VISPSRRQKTRLERIVADADELSRMDDPEEAFHIFFARVVGVSAGKKPITDAQNRVIAVVLDGLRPTPPPT